MIGIIDLGINNVAALKNLTKKLGYKSYLISKPDDFDGVEKIILPGVGSFDEGMTQLTHLGLVPDLTRLVLEDKIPILGICLGMQLLGRGSDEGELNGLNFVDMYFKKFTLELPVPHIGWNYASNMRSSSYLEVDERAKYYFTHSYYCAIHDPDIILMRSKYGLDFASAIEKENIIGVQFHPEKSHRFGRSLLRSFCD